jgi:hypothetical protein
MLSGKTGVSSSEKVNAEVGSEATHILVFRHWEWRSWQKTETCLLYERDVLV